MCIYRHSIYIASPECCLFYQKRKTIRNCLSYILFDLFRMAASCTIFSLGLKIFFPYVRQNRSSGSQRENIQQNICRTLPASYKPLLKMLLDYITMDCSWTHNGPEFPANLCHNVRSYIITCYGEFKVLLL